MVLNDLLHHGQSQASAIFLAEADKWLEELGANRLRDPPAIVGNQDFHPVRDLAYFYVNLSRFQLHRLTCVEQKIKQGAFQLFLVKPPLAISLLPDADADFVKFGMGADGLNDAFDCDFDTPV